MTLASASTHTATETPTRGASVQLNGVSMVYGHDAPAVDNVQLDIPPGQFVTLLGASGSGKTTLLRIVAGFLTATSGQVVIDGNDVSRVPVYKRGIGMVFQNYALFPHMSVAKNVTFPLAMAKVPKKERAAMVDEALAQVHLGPFAHRMPSELSGGQQQRVALARAIVARPRLLLMDEPLGALDRRLREDLQVEIRRLGKELGVTVINVTHDQEEALTMSDRIALLIGGKLAQYGSPEELYNRPADEAVAAFLGESNIFTGEVTAGERGTVLTVDGGSVHVDPQAAAGSTATVMVRPNHLGIAAHRGIADLPRDTSWVPATIVATMFAGDSRKVIAETPSGKELVVRLSPDAAGIDDGTAVMLTWPAEHAVTLAG